jgi:hypothetical protein
MRRSLEAAAAAGLDLRQTTAFPAEQHTQTMIRRIISIAAVAAVSLPAAAQDAARGKLLYEAYRERSRSLVRTLPQLKAEVAKRAELTGQRFSLDDLEDIAEYLNRSHYQLEK